MSLAYHPHDRIFIPTEVAPRRLETRGRTLGAVEFGLIGSRRYDELDVRVAEQLGRSVALAIENEKLFEVARREELRAEEASRAKDHFLATLSHALRTPSASFSTGCNSCGGARCPRATRAGRSRSSPATLGRRRSSSKTFSTWPASRPASSSCDRCSSTPRASSRQHWRPLAPSFLPFVFERFRQADGGSARAQGGLGLGLAIVKHIIELHGGAVSVESAGEGRGATFTVRLPSASREADSATN